MLRLRPYKPCDANKIVSWIKDEETFYKWSAGRIDKYPICADDLNNHYDEFKDSDSFFQMTALDDTEVVGQLIMRFTDEEKKNLRFGFVIVDASKRGKGYGKGMIMLALQYAFDILKVDRVTIGVFDNNIPAYECYKRAGFNDNTDVENEVYSIMGQKWECLELYIDKRGK